jgi:hypothetical protein
MGEVRLRWPGALGCGGTRLKLCVEPGPGPPVIQSQLSYQALLCLHTPCYSPWLQMCSLCLHGVVRPRNDLAWVSPEAWCPTLTMGAWRTGGDCSWAASSVGRKNSPRKEVTVQNAAASDINTQGTSSIRGSSPLL